MAFPSVVAPRGTSGSLPSQTTHTIAMPASATTARGVLVIVSADSAPTITTTSTGWAKLNQINNAALMGSAIFYKRPNVTLSTLTVTFSFAEEGTYVVLPIDAAAPTEDPYTAGLAVTGTNTNPPNLTPTGGARDYLWIASRCGEAAVVATAAPANFANLTTATGTASSASTQTAERQLNAASLDPGAFTSATEDCVAWTIAVPPGITNTAPVVSAGADASINIDTAFSRTATEDNGGATITARSWTVVSGPSGAGSTIGTAAALSYTPSAVGTYVLRYSATNSEGTSTDDMTLTVNQIVPVVNAGADATITVGQPFNRTATESGGVPASRAWTVQSGPADVGSTIGTAAALSYTPSVTGVYTLRYAATNTAGTATDDVVLTVHPAAPVVDAGADVSVVNGTTLVRTATETGVDITARSWTIVSGPTGVGDTIG